MLKTLKIAKLIAGLAAIAFIAYLTMSGLKPDADVEAILNKQSAIEKFKQLIGLASDVKDPESAFVTQAKKFALRINPPKPPKPVKKPGEPVTTKKPLERPKIDRPAPPKPTRTTKFSLLATVRYEEQPEKSLALLNVVAEGQKWVRQGEAIGHLTVNLVNDGSIVLFQDGELNTEIFVPPVKKPKQVLLKDPNAEEKIAEAPKIKEKINYEPTGNKAATASKKYSTDRTSAATSRARNLRPIATVPKAKPRRIQTPEEQKKSLENNISQIKNIMSETMKTSKDSDNADEMKAWGDLLKTLQTDKDKIVAEPPAKPGSKTSEGGQRPSVPSKAKPVPEKAKAPVEKE
jgi:hypothetical protein